MNSPEISAWQDVRIWGIQDRRADARATRPWVVRWAVDGRSRGRTFRTKAEAEGFRSALLMAKRLQETFDPETAEPLSWSPPPAEIQAHTWARRWVGEQWMEWQPRSRASAIEALARFVPLLATGRARPAPATIRAYLTTSLRPGTTVDAEDPCERWMEESIRSLASLNREILAEVDTKLGLGIHGQRLSPSTANRYRKISHACVRRAVELEVISRDPWPPIPKGRRQRKSMRSRQSIDIRVLPAPTTMRAALDAIVTHQPGSRTYRVMTAVAYYGGLRPSEVVMLRPRALTLPGSGWGRIDVVEADVSRDEPGEPKTGERSVPIPPVLVAIMRDWLGAHDFGPDDLIFRTRNGRLPSASNWSRAWHRALRATGHRPLRIYDCRHAAATTWLAAGVPLGEVARRLGHSVETLVST
ncbi:MAG: tyrosine-type recombinase/integrase [Aeromicrobium sp.]